MGSVGCGLSDFYYYYKFLFLLHYNPFSWSLVGCSSEQCVLESDNYGMLAGSSSSLAWEMWQRITFVGREQLLTVAAKPGNPEHAVLHDCRCCEIKR